jgi:hypothetical protein
MSGADSSQQPLTVVGGTYVERSFFPAVGNIYGSGLRAAAAVSKRGTPVEFHTFVSDGRRADLRATAAIFGIELHASAYPETFVFEYLHTLALPSVDPLAAPKASARLEVRCSQVLGFGMMEGNPLIHGNRVVYDPQCPNNPLPFSANGSTAGELAVVCNQKEARLLTGVQDLPEAGRALLQQSNAKVVIIKHGAAGALVFTESNVSTIPAYRNRATSLIGSGDVFSATFAYHWLVLREDPVAAAIVASQSTAFYCATQVLPVPWPLPTSFPLVAVESERPLRRVYLAGPFFAPHELWMVNEARQCLEQQGLEVFSPFHDVGLGHPDVVAKRDLEEIEACDLVFALLDGRDPGTIFEVGYARALKKPVIAFSTSEEKVHLTMFLGSGCDIHHNFVAAIYAAAWTE